MAQKIHGSLTWYEATAARRDGYQLVAADMKADACVIGGGLAGLTVALEVARMGKQVVLIEAERVAWGASGRNGGFVSSGFAQGMDKVFAHLGRDAARSLYVLSDEGAEYVRRAAAEYDAIMGQGMIVAQRHPDQDALQSYCAFMDREFGAQLAHQDVQTTRAALDSPRYFASFRNAKAFHIHPLRYALALAGQAAAHGVKIFEHTRALTVERQAGRFQVKTDRGTVTALDVVHCVSSLDRKIHVESGRAVLPVATYVAVTEPLSQDAIRTSAAIADTRRAGDYYRLVDQGRILWGGRITTRIDEPQRLADRMRGDMISTYPQLAEARIEYAWAGLMGYALHKMPLIGRAEDGQWFATAFGGHGINTTAMAGLLVARAIAQDDDEYRRFASYAPRWAGGPFGRAGVQGSYWWMQIRDRMEERKPS